MYVCVVYVRVREPAIGIIIIYLPTVCFYFVYSRSFPSFVPVCVSELNKYEQSIFFHMRCMYLRVQVSARVCLYAFDTLATLFSIVDTPTVLHAGRIFFYFAEYYTTLDDSC